MVLLLPRLGLALDPPDSLSVLFVADGWYEQEDDIESHLLDLGYDVTVKADYQVYGSTELSVYDLVVITEFAPGLSYSALDNIESSEVPVLIVEYWDFWYSYRLGLTTTEQCGYVGTMFVEAIGHDHPATFGADDETEVYTSSYTVYGIDESDIEPGVTPLYWSSSSFGEVAVLVDDARNIAATGVYKTGRYTADAWMLFDSLVAHITRAAIVPPTIEEVYDRMAWCGAAELLGEISEDRERWTPSEARAAVWPLLVRAGITNVRADVFDLIDLVLVHNWALVPYFDPPGAEPRWSSLLLVPGDAVPPGQMVLAECVDWASSLRDETSRRLPTAVSYQPQAAGIPRLEFEIPHEFEDQVLQGTASDFAVSLTCYDEFALQGFPAYFPVSGATELLSSRDFHESTGYQNFYWSLYWWGRRTNSIFAPTPEITSESSNLKEPFSRVVRHTSEDSRQVQVALDFFRFHEGDVESKRSPRCAVRFFDHPYADADGWYDDASWAAFDTAEMPTELTIPLPYDLALECDDQASFNPFDNEDSTPGDSLPNCFCDASEGENDIPTAELDGLLPRVQMMWPSNHFISRHHPIEAYCEANLAVCQGVVDGVQADVAAFDEHFGLDELAAVDSRYADYGNQLLRKRRRQDVPWAGPALDEDRGPWQRPRLKAGLDTKVAFLVRNEKENIPPDAVGGDYERAVCRPDGADPIGTATLWYTPRDGGDDLSTPPVDVYCVRTAINDDLLDSHGTAQGDGLTIGSGLFEVPADAAFGAAQIRLEADVVLVRDDETEDVVTVERTYPVFIDPVEAIEDAPGALQDRYALDMEGTRPAAWIGTGKIEGAQYEYRKSAFQTHMEPFCEEDDPSPKCRALDWLVSADEGPWLQREWDGHDTALLTLFGDISIKWYGNTDPLDFDWFDYRGSSLAFEVIDADQAWAIDDYDDDGYGYVHVPAIEPLMTQDGLPWEMVRAPGAGFENGVYSTDCQTTDNGCIVDCAETGAETVAPMSAFQLPSQHGSGEAYVWFGVASDWGRSGIPGAGEVASAGSDPLTGFNIGVFHHDYDEEYDPWWWSFIGRWHPRSGVDDLGRSVSWRKMESFAEATTFVVSSAVVVEELGALLGPHVVDGGVEQFVGDGILVWHTGRYRASAVYLSYAREADVLDPAAYRHFAGWDGGAPSWSEHEYNAAPVIWDNVGELTALDLGDSGENDTVFERFVVLYQVNAYAQEGIVLRQADAAWGPYSQTVVLYDCAGPRLEMLEEYTNGVPPEALLDGFSGCYGGFTHERLWGDKGSLDEVGDDQTKLRFNVSLWRPYKALLVESTVEEVSPQ